MSVGRWCKFRFMILTIANSIKNWNKRLDVQRHHRTLFACWASFVCYFCSQTVEPALELQPVFVAESTDFMKKELKRSNPDMAKIEDAMERTFSARRRTLVNDHPALVEFLTMYPALRLEKQVSFLGFSKTSCFNLLHNDHFLWLANSTTQLVIEADRWLPLNSSFPWVNQARMCTCY